MQLMTANLRQALPPLYSQEHVDAMVIAKYFTPDGNWTWYATEFDGEDLFFGLVKGHETEFGYFRLSELQRARGPLGLRIELDKHWTPKPISEVQRLLSERGHA